MKRESRTKSAQRQPLLHERKKAPARERATPLPPLSDTERAALIGYEHGAAQIHLREAIALLAWGKAPNACAHSAYYGMYHAATATLHIAGGVGKTKRVPQSHEHVLQHFTNLAETAGDDGVVAAQLLNRARSVRITADYGGAEPPDEESVAQCVADARRFIEVCVQRLGLPEIDLSPAAEAAR